MIIMSFWSPIAENGTSYTTDPVGDYMRKGRHGEKWKDMSGFGGD